MKKIATLLTACLLLVLTYSATAQSANKCCSGTTVAPELTPGFYVPQIGATTNTPAPVLGTVGSSDLPNTEYIVTKRNAKALNDMGTPDTTGGGGDVILGADIDGIFMPTLTRYGVVLNPGDTFDITAVGYSLPIIKKLADSLLNGTSPGSGPCCGLFGLMATVLNQPALAGFCDSVNAAGIYGAGDINGMNEVLAIFDVFSTGQTSISSVISTLQIINANGTFISTDCGGTGQNNFVPYGVNRSKKYGYDKEGTIAVQQLSDVSSFMMYPNPTKDGDVYVYFSTSKQIDLNINVYDAVGHKVHSQTLGSVSGNFNTQIPVTNFAAGMYYVELTDGYSNQTHKLMVK